MVAVAAPARFGERGENCLRPARLVVELRRFAHTQPHRELGGGVHLGERRVPPSADQGLGHRAALFMQPEAARSEGGLAQRLRITVGFGESRRAVEQAARTRQVALASQSLPGRSKQPGKFVLSAVWRLIPHRNPCFYGRCFAGDGQRHGCGASKDDRGGIEDIQVGSTSYAASYALKTIFWRLQVKSTLNDLTAASAHRCRR